VHAAPAVSCANAHKERAHEHTGTGGASRPSLRSGLTAYFVLSPVNGSFATVIPEMIVSQEFDASTAASGPHDFAVREQLALVLRQRRVHRISPRVRDVRTPLSSGETRGVKSLICPTAKAEYFCSEHWTVFADLPVVLLCRIWRGRILLARKAKQQAWLGMTNRSSASRACETPASFG
jgi:hypothetical protein